MSEKIAVIIHLESGRTLYPDKYRRIIDYIDGMNKERVYLVRDPRDPSGSFLWIDPFPDNFGVPEKNIIFSTYGHIPLKDLPPIFYNAIVELMGFFQGRMSCVDRAEESISKYARKVEVLTDKVGSVFCPVPEAD